MGMTTAYLAERAVPKRVREDVDAVGVRTVERRCSEHLVRAMTVTRDVGRRHRRRRQGIARPDRRRAQAVPLGRRQADAAAQRCRRSWRARRGDGRVRAAARVRRRSAAVDLPVRRRPAAGLGRRDASAASPSLNGLEDLPDEVRIVVVHDAARPLVDDAMIDASSREARAGTGAVAALPVVDTLKEVDRRRARRANGRPRDGSGARRRRRLSARDASSRRTSKRARARIVPRPTTPRCASGSASRWSSCAGASAR